MIITDATRQTMSEAAEKAYAMGYTNGVTYELGQCDGLCVEMLDIDPLDSLEEALACAERNNCNAIYRKTWGSEDPRFGVPTKFLYLSDWIILEDGEWTYTL